MQLGPRTERGDATTEAVLITPVLLIVIGVIINFALWYHASQIAMAATQEGARAAHVEGALAQDGESTTTKYISQLGASLVLGPQIDVQRTNVETRVDLRAHSVAVVPGLAIPIHARSVVPNEAFRPAP